MKTAQIGKYKVAYWKDGGIVASQMFDELPPAEKFLNQVESQGYITIVMESIQAANGNYIWEVKKGGVGAHLNMLSWIYPYRWLIALGLGYWIL